MSISFENLTPISSILVGILILMFPKFLNYLIAGYLILTGVIALGILIIIMIILALSLVIVYNKKAKKYKKLLCQK